MSVESPSDRSMFLTDFGVMAAYAQAGGGSMALRGIFDRQHLAIDAGDGAVTGFAVVFTCRSDDLALLSAGRALQGDTITIDGEGWEVVEPQPDGTGIVTLVLRKASA